MALVACVFREGVAQFYAGSKLVTLPGTVVRPDNATDWVVGANVWSASGLRFWAEDTNDPLAYWTLLTEGVTALRVIGALDVVVGMGRLEYERIYRAVGKHIKEQLGAASRVMVRYGDHYALYGQEPWRSNPQGAAGSEAVVLRIGAQDVHALHFAGAEVTAEQVFHPGWYEAVLGPALQKEVAAGGRRDLHELAWAGLQAADSEPEAAWGQALLRQLAQQGWSGNLVVTGLGGALLRQMIKTTPTAFTVVDEVPEVVGLWHFANRPVS